MAYLTGIYSTVSLHCDRVIFLLIFLPGGKGWEASVVSKLQHGFERQFMILKSSSIQGQNQILAQIQNAGLNSTPQRRDDRQHRDPERRRVSQGGPGGVIPPSPALVRHGSKQRKIPAALTPGSGNMPGQVTPLSAAAQINVPVSTPMPSRGGHGGGHPYASVTPGGYDYGGDESFRGQQYGRASPMVPSVGAAPPAVSQVRARGDVGAPHVDDFHGHGEASKSSLWKILTCRCG